MENLLSIITFIPLVAAAILALVQRGGGEAADRNAKWFALTATTVTFLVSLFVLAGFDASNTGMQFVEDLAAGRGGRRGTVLFGAVLVLLR